MIKIKQANYITCDDVTELTGVPWCEFEFAHMAENDSYQILCCDDAYLEELYEDFEDCKWELEEYEDDLPNSPYLRRNIYANRIRNQIKLVEILRKTYGIRDSILVWVSW